MFDRVAPNATFASQGAVKINAESIELTCKTSERQVFSGGTWMLVKWIEDGREEIGKRRGSSLERVIGQNFYKIQAKQA